MNEALSPSDEELVRRGRGGDRAAFEQLFERHTARLQRLIRAQLAIYVRVHASVADVLQDVLAGAWKALRNFEDRGPRSFATWLTRIASNRVNSVLRKHYGRANVFRPSMELPPALIAIAQQTSPSEAAEVAALKKILAEGLEQLTYDQRAAMRLVIGKGLSHKAAAEELGASEGAIGKRVERARAFLREYVRRRWDGLS